MGYTWHVCVWKVCVWSVRCMQYVVIECVRVWEYIWYVCGVCVHVCDMCGKCGQLCAVYMHG